MSVTNLNSANQFDFSRIGWRYYNNIKKKAMEQEFSWSGLLVSLSIAFFIVVFSAFSLGILNNAVVKAHNGNKFIKKEAIEEVSKFEMLPVLISGQELPRVEYLNLA